MPWSPVDLAYLAGLFDGEGSVEARYNSRKNRAPDWTARIHVYNTDGHMIEWLAATFAGRVTTIRKEHCTAARRDVYRWSLSAQSGRPLLTALLPYLRVKNSQVEMLLALLDLMGKPGCQRVEPANLQERFKLVDNIQLAKWEERRYAR